jgi:hypothetical protein
MQKNGQQFHSVSPEALRNLVEGAAAYASSCGIAACREWPQITPIFGDIDPSQCLTQFTYGKDGKPFFMPGPSDSESRIRQIIDLLHRNAGQENYNFALVMPADDDIEPIPDSELEPVDALEDEGE